jgi:hypothetical protein
MQKEISKPLAFFLSAFVWAWVVVAVLFVSVLMRFVFHRAFPGLSEHGVAQPLSTLMGGIVAVLVYQKARAGRAARQTLGSVWTALARFGGFCGYVAFILTASGVVNRVILHRDFYHSAGILLGSIVITTSARCLCDDCRQTLRRGQDLNWD